MFTIRLARPDDAPDIGDLLNHNKQSAQDILVPNTQYWLAEASQGGLIGTVGLEFGPEAVLLRSAGVLPAWRSQGVGRALTQQALTTAGEAGYDTVYLFSTGAGRYWQRWGFYEVPVAEMVAALPDVPQVREYDRRGWLATEVAWRHDLSGLTGAGRPASPSY